MPTVTAAELAKMAMQLVQRLDATTAYLFDLEKLAKTGHMIDVKRIGQEIADNMAILDQFREEEPKQ